MSFPLLIPCVCGLQLLVHPWYKQLPNFTFLSKPFLVFFHTVPNTQKNFRGHTHTHIFILYFLLKYSFAKMHNKNIEKALMPWRLPLLLTSISSPCPPLPGPSCCVFYWSFSSGCHELPLHEMNGGCEPSTTDGNGTWLQKEIWKPLVLNCKLYGQVIFYVRYHTEQYLWLFSTFIELLSHFLNERLWSLMMIIL